MFIQEIRTVAAHLPTTLFDLEWLSRPLVLAEDKPILQQFIENDFVRISGDIYRVIVSILVGALVAIVTGITLWSGVEFLKIFIFVDKL